MSTYLKTPADLAPGHVRCVGYVPRSVEGAVGDARREKHFVRQWSLIDCDTGFEEVTVRHYVTPSVASCCVWVRYRENPGSDTPASGRGAGWAKGGGYDRGSSAMAEALAQAGFRFDDTDALAGRGWTAERDHLNAIAVYLGLARWVVVQADA